MKKKKNYTNSKLPDELVLTNITDQGPKKAIARINYSTLPADLVLTEINEEGPRPKKIKEDDDDDVVVIDNDDEDLNRYEGTDDLFE